MKLSRMLAGVSVGTLCTAGAALGQWSVTILDPAGTSAGTSSSIASGTSGNQQVGSLSTNFGYQNATLWTGTAASAVNLKPVLNGVQDSQASAVENGVQVGYFVYFTGTGYVPRACRWTGTAASMFRLDPNTFTGSSAALAIDGDRASGYMQVGTTAQPHAVIWGVGASTAYTDLHPTSEVGSGTPSSVLAARGGKQVGYVQVGVRRHASLWTGTAASWVDLHPAGAVLSEALAVDGNEQYGYYTVGSESYPAIWSGTAASLVDVTPPWSSNGRINAALTGTQVGSSGFGGKNHAMLWRGTAASAFDLHAVLPAEFDESRALGISKDATHIYVVGSAHPAGDNYLNHAVMWTYTICPGDFDGVDGVSVQDIFEFLNAWFAGDVRADVDGVEGLSVQDIFAFLNAWFAAC